MWAKCGQGPRAGTMQGVCKESWRGLGGVEYKVAAEGGHGGLGGVEYKVAAEGGHGAMAGLEGTIGAVRGQ